MPEQQEKQVRSSTFNWWWVIIPLMFFFTIFGLIFFNKTTEKCGLGQYKEGFCVFAVTETLKCDGQQEENICKIDAKGELENPKLWYWFFALIGLIIVIYLSFRYIKKPVIELESSEYKKYNPEEVKKSIEKYFVKSFNLPYQLTTKKEKLKFWKQKEDLNYNREDFDWYEHHQPFIKGNGEWFFQAQLHITSSIHTGIYTVLVSLARDLNEIEEGLFRWSKTLFEHYKLDEIQKPYYQPRTERQRVYERLISLGREDLLTQLAEREAEALVQKIPSEKPQQITQVQPLQQVPIQQPFYRQPYRRSLYGRYR